MRGIEQVTSHLFGRGKHWKAQNYLAVLSAHAFQSPQHTKLTGPRSNSKLKLHGVKWFAIYETG